MWTWWVVVVAQNWKFKMILLFLLFDLNLILLFQVALVETAYWQKIMKTLYCSVKFYWKCFANLFVKRILSKIFCLYEILCVLLFPLNTVWKFVIVLVSLLFIGFIACCLRQSISRLLLVCQSHSLKILWKLSTVILIIDYVLMIWLIDWLICKWISAWYNPHIPVL